ncbi:MAG TPA: hypothetical protein VI981_03345 [Candidatus Paceibacterota bacterium]
MEEEYKKILKREGFNHVYEWHDKANQKYEEHAHKGKVSIFITGGSITFNLDGKEYMFQKGERFNVPIGRPHIAIIGPSGCSYVIGEMVKGDT